MAAAAPNIDTVVDLTVVAAPVNSAGIPVVAVGGTGTPGTVALPVGTGAGAETGGAETGGRGDGVAGT